MIRGKVGVRDESGHTGKRGNQRGGGLSYLAVIRNHPDLPRVLDVERRRVRLGVRECRKAMMHVETVDADQRDVQMIAPDGPLRDVTHQLV